MYRTCMFCKEPLGSNEVVEAFPVGRRLAFDPAKGRLWVVCRSCERWNLTPLEERWEAVETCERLFRATRIRTSTENIGLARHTEGLELVRIGEPLRPEFAAWRYGDQFRRRRRRWIVAGSAGVAANLATLGDHQLDDGRVDRGSCGRCTGRRRRRGGLVDGSEIAEQAGPCRAVPALRRHALHARTGTSHPIRPDTSRRRRTRLSHRDPQGTALTERPGLVRG